MNPQVLCLDGLTSDDDPEDISSDVDGEDGVFRDPIPTVVSVRPEVTEKWMDQFVVDLVECLSVSRTSAVARTFGPAVSEEYSPVVFARGGGGGCQCIPPGGRRLYEVMCRTMIHNVDRWTTRNTERELATKMLMNTNCPRLTMTPGEDDASYGGTQIGGELHDTLDSDGHTRRKDDDILRRSSVCVEIDIPADMNCTAVELNDVTILRRRLPQRQDSVEHPECYVSVSNTAVEFNDVGFRRRRLPLTEVFAEGVEEKLEHLRGMSPNVHLSHETWGHINHKDSDCECQTSDQTAAYVHDLTTNRRGFVHPSATGSTSEGYTGLNGHSRIEPSWEKGLPGVVPFVSDRPGAYGRILLAVYVRWRTSVLVSSDWLRPVTRGGWRADLPDRRRGSADIS